MRYQIIFTALLIFCTGCRAQYTDSCAGASPVRIHRFDKAILRLLESGNDVAVQGELLCDYPLMLEVLAKGVLNMQTPQVPGFFDRLTAYYSEPSLNELYRDAVAMYDSVGPIERQLGCAFAYLGQSLPSMPLPQVYMHVSGLSLNVLAADDLLSISIDKYMGADYPLYKRFFYPFQREKMRGERLVADYLAGWLMSEYPFGGNEGVLLDRMIYEGKIRYIISQALPLLSPHTLMGYTAEEYAWCMKNEAGLWTTIIERKHLYTPDLTTTEKYIADPPASFLAAGAPGNIGVWIGLQIVNKYMEETAATPEELMQERNAQDILAQSRYKPF
ncbi:MAG: gliding motility protein GldB [Tannerellaceae bacterium]|jgi:hypothetical protein|nr:gliding motility protein GldB [Tannerellaceae bacterium]